MIDLHQLVDDIASAWRATTGTRSPIESLRRSVLTVLARANLRAPPRTSSVFVAHVMEYATVSGVDPTSLVVWAALQIDD